VLVHCTAGKDRTGVAVALMLDAAGAERDAIVADYASSQANLAGPWAESMLGTITAMGVPITDSLRTLVTATPPAAIEQALTWVDGEGGAAAYLQSGGLSDSELDALRGRLTA
jgi:protein-tyrosine phosphatase